MRTAQDFRRIVDMCHHSNVATEEIGVDELSALLDEIDALTPPPVIHLRVGDKPIPEGCAAFGFVAAAQLACDPPMSMDMMRYTVDVAATTCANCLRSQVAALTPPSTMRAEISLNDGELASFPAPDMAGIPVDPLSLIGLRELCKQANDAWEALDGVASCTVVMTLLTDAVLYTYHLETAYGTFVGKPVVLPYAVEACGFHAPFPTMDTNPPIYPPSCTLPKDHIGRHSWDTAAPSIITPDMIGEVITPIVDMSEVEARDVQQQARWTGKEKDRPLTKDPGVARFLEGGGE